MKNFGLPKKCLLRKSREFEQVYRYGKRIHGRGFTLVYYMNTFDFNRLGISIHRQIKGAVKRNRIKRMIRESFRLHRYLYPARTDIVFTVKPNFAIDSSIAVNKAVSLLFQQVGSHHEA